MKTFTNSRSWFWDPWVIHIVVCWSNWLLSIDVCRSLWCDFFFFLLFYDFAKIFCSSSEL